MNVTPITTTESNPVRSVPGRWQITSPVGAPPLRFFRRAACLCFETGGIADRIRTDLESPILEAVFEPYDYDALSQSKTSLRASLTDSEGGAVIVALEAPRQVREVHLSPDTAAPGSDYSLEFYRLDGSTLADKPTTSVSVQNDVATLPSSNDFTDIRFAVRLKGPTGQPLRADDLDELWVRGYPTGLRLGIADPKDAGSAVFFWQVAGEVGKAVPADQGNVKAGKALADALERHLDDLFDRLAERTDDEGRPLPTPDFVEVALIAASDAPCILDVTAFDVRYHLVLQSLFSDDKGEKVEKQVLQLTSDRPAVQGVRLPGNTTVKSATLETVESFGDDRLLAAGNGEGLSDAILAKKEGVYVGVERWVAQGVTLPHAMSASGMAVALMATADNTEVLVELQEDWRGQPSGRKLASRAITLQRAGRRNWATLLFSEAVVLPSTPHWILMKAARGRAVWLADAGDVPVRVLEGADYTEELSVLDGLQAMYGFLSRSKQAQKQQPVSLTIGEHVVAATDENGTNIYDMAFAINDYLGDLPPSTSAVVVPLIFRGASRGFVTVYPPIIEYDLA
jgi:hypothetical protein